MTDRLNSTEPYAIGLFRIVMGLLFAVHGAASLFGVLGGTAGTDGGSIPSGTWPGWYAAVIELVGGALVLLGLRHPRRGVHRVGLDGVRVLRRAPVDGPVADPERRRALRAVLLDHAAAGLHRLRRARPRPSLRRAHRGPSRADERASEPVAA